MKKILLIATLAAFTAGFAQENKNEKTETVVTKTAVKSEKGTEVSTKAVTKSQQQVIALDDSDENETNQSVVMKPMEVNTNVSYGYDGNRFQFMNQKDENGYRLMTVKDNATQEEYAIIKPTSQSGYYIMSQNGNSSFGYFNSEGNFVVERYDSKTNTIVSDVYKLQMNNTAVDRK